MKVRIITDDFTSATDGVVAFAQAGWKTSIALTPCHGDDADAISVDTDSRACPADEAHNRVAQWALRWRGAQVLVKQFDSTLRGNIADECVAAWHASGRKRLLIISAFPAAGRTVVDGTVLVEGVPVGETAFANDPLCPVTQSRLAPYFSASGVALQVATTLTDAVRAFHAGACAVSLDIQSDVQLLDAARHFLGDADMLWAGSTGIVRALAQIMPPKGPAALRKLRACVKPLVVIGSLNPVSHRQLAPLAQQLLHVAQMVTMTALQNPAQATQDLAAQAARAIQSDRCDGLVVTGGETAKAIAHALSADELTALYEVESGVPLCLLRFAGRTIPIITKAGGFGDSHTLLRCVATLLEGHA